MQDVNVLVVFQSRGESIERLALAAAVGAVQGRANIRLRCLETSPDSEFIAPRDSDAEWADAILMGPAEAALEAYVDSLRALGEKRTLERKIGASFADGSGTASLLDALQRAGLTTVDMVCEADALTVARLQGRSVAEARSQRLRTQ